MSIYETIISILDEKGPLSIPLICHEVNQLLVTNEYKPILPSHIKSIVTRKKEPKVKHTFLKEPIFTRKNGLNFANQSRILQEFHLSFE